VTGARRGLGLALVSQIVEGVGGMVSVGQDGGAVFTAVLPGCLEPAEPAARTGPVALPPACLPATPADPVPSAMPRPLVVL
jgi:hypothetical protein